MITLLVMIHKQLTIKLLKNLMEPHRMQAMNSQSKSANLGQLSRLSDAHMMLKNRLPKPMLIKPIVLAIATMSLGFAVNAAHAGERESLEQLRSTTVSLVNLLVQEGVLSKAKAEDLLRQASQDAVKAREKDALAEAEKAQPNPQDAGVEKVIDEKMVRVQYVPDIVKQEIKDEIKKEVMTKLNYKAGERLGLPDWIDRFQWEGDLRLRYQGDRFAEGNPSANIYNVANFNSPNQTNTTEDQDRMRIRARLGVNVKVNDWMKAGLRITTGSANDPTSHNQTLGTKYAKHNFGLDLAYLKAEVKPWLNLVGGRFANPWLHTDLVWDPDLTFDGVAASFTPKITDSWSSFLTLGAFPLEQTEVRPYNALTGVYGKNKAKSKWMYGSQVGIKWTSPNLSTVKLGLAMYDFSNVEGIKNTVDDQAYDATTPSFRTKGNSYYNITFNPTDDLTEKYGLVSKFRTLNLTGQVDIATFNPVHVILTGDYVRNIGFDAQEISNRTGLAPSKEVNGYQVKLAVGMPNTYQANEWQAFAAYKYLEADAVLDSYTDSAFHLGGTNAKGWIVGASYGIDKNTWLTAGWFSADEISPRLSRGVAIAPLNIDVLRLDLIAKF